MPMTQLVIFFIPKNLSVAISDLQSTASLISSWMSSNYLTLNPSSLCYSLNSFPTLTHLTAFNWSALYVDTRVGIREYTNTLGFAEAIQSVLFTFFYIRWICIFVCLFA